MKLIIFTLIPLILSIGIIPVIPFSDAAKITILDEISCPTILGIWDASTITCTIPSPAPGRTIFSGDELIVPSNTTLLLTCTSGECINNSGTLTVEKDGKIIKSSTSGYGIWNSGTLNNYGILILSNNHDVGLFSTGAINNYGVITVSSENTYGLWSQTGTITNHPNGLFEIFSKSGIGFLNQGSIDNNGMIIVSNIAGRGIVNDTGIVINSGKIYLCGGTIVGIVPTTGNVVIDGCPPVSDSTPPVITPNISGTLGTNGWYIDGVTVSWDVIDDESIITDTTGCDETIINSDTIGTVLTCSATSAGGSDSQGVTIKRDATVPEITLLGDAFIVVIQDEIYLDEGVTASDNVDGDITGDNITINPVDESTPDTYFVTYNVSDDAGNPAVQVTRTVIVISGNPSIICGEGTTLIGNECVADVTQDDLNLLQNIISNLNAVIAQLQSIVTGQSDAEICHKPGTNQESTMQVSVQQLQGHLNHGDTFGACVP